MNIIEFKKIEDIQQSIVHFIKIEVTDLGTTLEEILKVLADLSWLNKFDEEFMQNSFKTKAQRTINALIELFKNDKDSNIVSETGEYIVSELSREGIIDKLGYLDIPLIELLEKKQKGNPGFDFITENQGSEIIIFGEAKYSSSTNAYGKALDQINKFISNSKDIDELSNMNNFCSKASLINANNGIKGFAAAFSVTDINTDILINNIKNNNDFKKLLKYKEIVLVGVCIKIQ